MLRNLLVLVKHRWRLDKIQVLRYRDIHPKREQGRSIVVTLAEKNQHLLDSVKLKALDSFIPKVTGWERNPTGKLTGRLVDLTEYLDPERLADQSVDLNLKLMKWRISPSLDLEKIKHTKCLLLGAVDAEKTRTEFELLKRLIDEHDVIFLLMDTRESRWLPTVMGKAAGKIVMNAALGFDSFVVMRHGVKIVEDSAAELGCYFCNDIVAPMNCTVTRPGVAAIASALLVELLVSILQHPLGAAAPAPAPASRSDDRGSHPLGLVPHQIRDKIVDTYKEKGWDFVHKALNESGYVEDLSGLKEVQSTAEASAADIEWDDFSGTEDEIEAI
ncbi:Deoxycytidine monophosphate (dCMP) deaminase [Aspergillus alliaceus]|uniref:Deoxycytidine monophosphate (dCMP) deaminase n=1 Tax=Petromyces alliaceus TaxID=209559 RepID=A0A8H6ACX0_PETAA|nr:Deoxycytidine monophosphate (dCMP) deaminase [Aspergillus burnettii]